MKSISNVLAKGTIATVAAGAMAMASAVPAQAQSRYDYNQRDRGGIDVGDVIAGALIIGGIAAVASAVGGRNRGYNGGYVYEGGRYDNRYNNNGYGQQNPRQAVEQCVYAAQQNASRYSYNGGAQVTDIRAVDQRRDGYVIKGRIAVNQQSRNWRGSWGNDYRGYNDRYAGYDSGKFTCRVQYGRVTDLDYSGIRGL